MRSLILTILIMASTTSYAQKAEDYEPALFFAGSHVATELMIKGNKFIMRDWEIHPYNRLLSSFIVGTIMVGASNTDEGNMKLNATSAIIGIVTGNIFQTEW